MKDFNIMRRVIRLALLGAAVSSLSGCLAAMAVPLATTAGITAATNKSADRLTEHGAQVTRMNCSALRAEYARLEKDTAGKMNPFSYWAALRSTVKSVAAQKGCRL